ncbi:MAG: hypothetical protein DSY46_05235 [Hydrogenimonas sp.]|nr:MAG: hypothetical protein DSY46_05235 [Hydrogenimonas sp.]
MTKSSAKLFQCIKNAVLRGKVVWQKHALQRMIERGISRKEVKKGIMNGKVIENYFDDKPFPSLLVAYLEDLKPLHIVVSYSEEEEKCYVITAYRPGRNHFEDDLCTRRIQ